MWDEIARQELPSSRYFIVFWSRNYVVAQGCVRELSQAAELAAAGSISPLVLRLDDFPIFWRDDLPVDTKQVFADLKPLLDVRTSRPHVSVEDANHLVQRFIEPSMKSVHPMMHRDDLLESMRTSAQKERFKCFPTMWISGFPGSGRTTLVDQLNKSMTPNGRSVSIDINAASLPKQITLKLESAGLGADFERLQHVQNDEESDAPTSVAARIDRIYHAGNYVVFRHEKILQNNVDLPEWIDDVIASLQPTPRPKLFIVSQMPLSIERRKKCFDHMAEQRVSGFSNHEVLTFAESLLAHFDPQPERWSGSAVEDLVEAAQGNLGLLVTLAQAASSVIDLGEVDELVAHAKWKAQESIAYYVDWAFATLLDDVNCQRLLLFLNDVSPCDARDLASIFEGAEDSVLKTISRCVKLGFVERDSSGLYRLTPFLSGRLARHLVRADLVEWRRSIIEKFARAPIDFDATENEFVRIESRIQATFWSGKDELPPYVEKFVSASHWFQAGVRLYHAQQHPAAHRLLKKAFAQRESFSQASKIELIRYFGLSSIRVSNDADIDACILLLNSNRKSQEIASYLEGFKLERAHKYHDAKSKYEEALRLNQDKDSRLERIYRPLIKCILLTRYPDYGLAQKYAFAWGKVRQTVFSKHALCRIYLLWGQADEDSRDPKPKDLAQLYDQALSDLKAHPGGTGAYHEVLAEAAELEGDVESAVRELGAAIGVDGRFELRLKRWQLMANNKKLSPTVLLELEELKGNPADAISREIHLKGLVEIFATALLHGINSPQRLNRFASPLGSRDIGAIVSRVKRKTGAD
ncbi:MAG: hypothetical protein ABS75_12545 [Pelagibacterium sp. SCN 63-23]|nr:MAG: hypothetical protein ABS75_12545 [Pelagibacterium sp. SCN 63-23]